MVESGELESPDPLVLLSSLFPFLVREDSSTLGGRGELDGLIYAAQGPDDYWAESRLESAEQANLAELSTATQVKQTNKNKPTVAGDCGVMWYFDTMTL